MSIPKSTAMTLGEGETYLGRRQSDGSVDVELERSGASEAGEYPSGGFPRNDRLAETFVDEEAEVAQEPSHGGGEGRWQGGVSGHR
jgi:hypothetical protein